MVVWQVVTGRNHWLLSAVGVRPGPSLSQRGTASAPGGAGTPLQTFAMGVEVKEAIQRDAEQVERIASHHYRSTSHPDGEAHHVAGSMGQDEDFRLLAWDGHLRIPGPV